jgi:TM2 domain-containing membrane protein YozV
MRRRCLPRLLLCAASGSSLLVSLLAALLDAAGFGVGDVWVIRPGSAGCWLLACLSFLFAALAAITGVLWPSAEEEDVRRGLCPACGYDLRATPDRCPECGAIPAPPAV